MEKIKPVTRAAIKYYYPLLKRYAKRITGNAEAAETIARKALEDQYELNRLKHAKHLRQVSKTDVRNRCYYWEQAQIFIRPLIKINYKTPNENKVRSMKTSC